MGVTTKAPPQIWSPSKSINIKKIKRKGVVFSNFYLEWTKEHPLVKRIRLWRLFATLNQMPNGYVFNDYKSLPRVLLFEPGGSSAEVLLYGGKVVSWKNSQGEELLFMSKNTGGRFPKGGISLCFPQVANTGMMKEICWSKKNAKSFDNIPLRLTPTGNPSSVDLTLKTTANDSNTWPRSFELRLRVSLGPDKMTIISYIKNTDNASLSFTFALQNYLSVSDMSEVRVEGLETLDFHDNLQQGKRFTEQPDAITFDGEVDRVYTKTPGNIAIIDHNKKRTIVIRNEGLPDAGLWTPWDNATKASEIGFGDKDYQNMLSVDSGVLEKPIILKPLEEWKGYQELSIISSSYCSGQLDPKMVAFYAKV
ncbi:putative glucose-6-phosphate 1-epimerase isoform X1 [Lactuca sativa]|uniref:putative glucose-6-phosphate 1-epimerase isoform X1 n=2 Tax=Lactuca sativa TaxID=4236 RepID=UPI000CD90416|nr:putative glucose-6-phosphate 1-epimerase isoform X1 [Lactuca sativa]